MIYKKNIFKMLGKAALALATLAGSVNAEIFEFNRFALPGAKQLQVVYGGLISI